MTWRCQNYHNPLLNFIQGPKMISYHYVQYFVVSALLIGDNFVIKMLYPDVISMLESVLHLNS